MLYGNKLKFHGGRNLNRHYVRINLTYAHAQCCAESAFYTFIGRLKLVQDVYTLSYLRNSSCNHTAEINSLILIPVFTNLTSTIQVCQQQD